VTDDELLRGFEEATLPPAAFDHAAHVRVAYLMLRQAPLPLAAERFSSALRRFAAAAGVPGKYDAALTWRYLRLIEERRPGAGSWTDFAARNPDLLERRLRREPAPPA
jgi:hypothetical protein